MTLPEAIEHAKTWRDLWIADPRPPATAATVVEALTLLIEAAERKA